LKKGIYIIPNSITLCGMTLGFYAILSALKGASSSGADAVGHFRYAALAILFANIPDALDGWVARLTNSSSRFGLQLDSLSDMVTFGVAPAVLIFSWGLGPLTPHRLAWAASLIYVFCAALRLARFNVQVDTAESRSFTGMPTPSAATIVSSGVLLCIEESVEFAWRPHCFLALTFLLAMLMVSNIRYHSLKELNKLKKKSFWVLVAAAVLLVLMLVNPPMTIFFASALYLVSGLVEAVFRLPHRHRGLPPPAAPPAKPGGLRP
jgi:CDP-diacylglycerol--serine O-phosphatidyltransferase